MEIQNFYIENGKAVLLNNSIIGTNKMPNMGDYDAFTGGYICTDFNYRWWKVVVKYGKVCDACLDYSRKFYSIEFDYSDLKLCDTQGEMYDMIRDKYGIPYNKLREICGKVGDMPIKQYMYDSFRKIADYLAEEEQSKVINDLTEFADKNGYQLISNGYAEIKMTYR